MSAASEFATGTRLVAMRAAREARVSFTITFRPSPRTWTSTSERAEAERAQRRTARAETPAARRIGGSFFPFSETAADCSTSDEAWRRTRRIGGKRDSALDAGAHGLGDLCQ